MFNPVNQGIACDNEVEDNLLTSRTNQGAATSGRTTGITSKSTGGDRRGTPLPSRTYSRRNRSHKTSGRPCGATSRTAGSGCADQKDPCSSLRRVRDPRQQTGHARGRTCPSIMTQFGCRSYSGHRQRFAAQEGDGASGDSLGENSSVRCGVAGGPAFITNIKGGSGGRSWVLCAGEHGGKPTFHVGSRRQSPAPTQCS